MIDFSRHSRLQQMLNYLQDNISVYGDEDPNYYDTYSGHIKRTLAVLEREGYIVTWEDSEDPRRVWAAMK